MKKWAVLCLMALLCTGCAALPAEERSFVVVMGVQRAGDTWEISARIPHYQTGGGYVTVSSRGASLEEGLALLDAVSPMQLHPGQLRMIVFHEQLAASPDFRTVLDTLAQRQDLRLQAVICVTEDNVYHLVDQLEPQTGSRLSKSLDVLLEARKEQGVISAVTLAEALRMGERQCPVLTAAAMENEADTAKPGMDAAAGSQAAKGAGKVQWSGGWMMNASGRVTGQLTAGEMQILSLMSGTLHKGLLSMEEGTVQIRDARPELMLGGNAVSCRMTLRYTSSTMTRLQVEEALQRACMSVIQRMAAAGCDALGVGRQAIRHFADIQQWRLLDWPGLYPQLQWSVAVQTSGAA